MDATQPPQEPVREWVLEAEQELRLEIDFKHTVKIKLKSGRAELFGTELTLDPEYLFRGRKLAIFTWHGCTLDVKGQCSGYVAGETPMYTYLNTHLALAQLSAEAKARDEMGPRVLILGPTDVGKSTLAKILLNYSTKQSLKPLFVDIDPKEGTVAVPGALSTIAIARMIDAEDDFGASPTITNSTPYVLYYGQTSPTEKPIWYKTLLSNLAAVVSKKTEIDPEVRSSGIIIDSPSQFVESGGRDLLMHTITEFKVNVILVIGHERMYSDLKQEFNDNSGISIIKLHKSGGVVNRDDTFRKQSQSQKISEYFYGTPKLEHSPYSCSVNYADITIRQVGEGTLAPSSALPLGAQRKVAETRMVKIDPGEILLHSIMAVSNVPVDPDAALSVDEESRNIAKTPLAGFVYVSEVDEVRKKLTVLAPMPGRLPKKYFVLGSLKWIEI
ncbi:Pre-mRNA cleavage complex II protein Clp1-domain-containing protein [Polychytrium aggregatum]|uniref:Pre-mRNA cleavage complex II protein Clp1-domain-containing protein n=1 Tax=Polychytrium aggregatum TaxID=110093 RepID=UPI0022FE8B70|nr:Pre-mRNA cleavage complex II protein Clp1-domain-containing protein [Polychytrium aggregatum]KAI9208130.1 Pre-mRNA cleavage complex II protein Clp1-domain-containing protein [Polychytrium aggregatum]